MVICVEVRFHSLNDYRQFPAVVWLWGPLNLANLFWLKILLLPMGVWCLGWMAGTCRLWGRFEIFIPLCGWGFRFEIFTICDGILLCLMTAWIVRLLALTS